MCDITILPCVLDDNPCFALFVDVQLNNYSCLGENERRGSFWNSAPQKMPVTLTTT